MILRRYKASSATKLILVILFLILLASTSSCFDCTVLCIVNAGVNRRLDWRDADLKLVTKFYGIFPFITEFSLEASILFSYHLIRPFVNVADPVYV